MTGIYVAGGNIGAENPADSLVMGHRMYDYDGNNIYEVTLDLERNTHYLYKYRIGSAAEDWNGNWEDYLDGCGVDPWGERYFTTGFSDSMSVGPFCWNSCENCEMPNMSLSFDGEDDGVSGVASSSLDVSGDDRLTVSAWVKPASYHGVVFAHTNHPSFHQYALVVNPEGRLYFLSGLGDFEEGGGNVSNSSIPLEQWSHITLTYD